MIHPSDSRTHKATSKQKQFSVNKIWLRTYVFRVFYKLEAFVHLCVLYLLLFSSFEIKKNYILLLDTKCPLSCVFLPIVHKLEQYVWQQKRIANSHCPPQKILLLRNLYNYYIACSRGVCRHFFHTFNNNRKVFVRHVLKMLQEDVVVVVICCVRVLFNWVCIPFR